MINGCTKEEIHLFIPVFLFIPNLEVRNDSHVEIEQTVQSPGRGRTPCEFRIRAFSNSLPRCTFRDRKMSYFFNLIYSILLKGNNDHFYILVLEIKRKSIADLNRVHDCLLNFSHTA